MRSLFVLLAVLVAVSFAQQQPQQIQPPQPESPLGRQFRQYPNNQYSNQGYNTQGYQGSNSPFTQNPYGAGGNPYSSTQRFYNSAPSSTMSIAAIMSIIGAYIFAH